MFKVYHKYYTGCQSIGCQTTLLCGLLYRLKWYCDRKIQMVY